MSSPQPRLARVTQELQMTLPPPFTAPHFGLTVPDLDAAVPWYTATLGLRLLAGPLEVVEDDGAGGAVAQHIYGVGFSRFRFAHLATADGVGLELFEFPHPRSALRDGEFDYWQPGFNHFGLTAPRIEECAAAIVAAGGSARTEVLTVDEARGYRIAYLQDPWGSVIELCSHPYVEMWQSRAPQPRAVSS